MAKKLPTQAEMNYQFLVEQGKHLAKMRALELKEQEFKTETARVQLAVVKKIREHVDVAEDATKLPKISSN